MTTAATRDLIGALVCPRCRGVLDWQPEIRCRDCTESYGAADGVAVLFATADVVDVSPEASLDKLPRSIRSLATSVRERLQPPLVYMTPAGRARTQRFVNSCEGLVVNVGAGWSNYGPRVLNLDVYPSPAVHALASSEALPLPDGSVGGVVMEAVLEHVRDEGATLSEIGRVLRPGGRVYIDVPFLQPYHAAPGDYRRYTEQGLRTRMEQMGWRVEASGVSVGPGSSLALIGAHVLAMLVSGRSVTLYRLARVAIDPLLSLLRFADRWLEGHPKAQLAAGGVWVIARR